jgi:hypothetical protein
MDFLSESIHNIGEVGPKNNNLSICDDREEINSIYSELD